MNGKQINYIEMYLKTIKKIKNNKDNYNGN